MVGKHKNNSLIDKFCRCIKAVSLSQNLDRNKLQLKKGAVKLRDSKKTARDSKSKKTAEAAAAATATESAAIAVCVNSVLKTRGKTLRKFSCKNKKLLTTKL